MSKQVKASTVTLPPETIVKLRDVSAARKKNKNLAWSHENIVIEQIDNLHKKECKDVSIK